MVIGQPSVLNYPGYQMHIEILQYPEVLCFEFIVLLSLKPEHHAGPDQFGVCTMIVVTLGN